MAVQESGLWGCRKAGGGCAGRRAMGVLGGSDRVQ